MGKGTKFPRPAGNGGGRGMGLQQLAVAADVGLFQNRRQRHVEQDAGEQIGKVGRR